MELTKDADQQNWTGPADPLAEKGHAYQYFQNMGPAFVEHNSRVEKRFDIGAHQRNDSSVVGSASPGRYVQGLVMDQSY
jgi:hypothetical protein